MAEWAEWAEGELLWKPQRWLRCEGKERDLSQHLRETEASLPQRLPAQDVKPGPG